MAKVFVIAEAGVNHNGSEELALRMVNAAADAGADAVKFQTFRAEALVTRGAATADYQLAATGNADQFQLLKQLELSDHAHRLVADACRARGIEFMSTPFDFASAEFLLDLGVRRLKIPSGEITNLPFLAFLAAQRRPLILSTGMSTLDEVEEAVGCIRSAWIGDFDAGYLTLLHCTSAYPAESVDANLRAVQTLARHFELPVGYSDHTLGTHVSVAAVALGACVIEKHFTLDRSLPGPDHQASLSPVELAELVRLIAETQQALGDGVKVPRPVELRTRELVRRSLVARVDLPPGTMISVGDIAVLRPGTGLHPRELARILGRRTTAFVRAGRPLRVEDLE